MGKFLLQLDNQLQDAYFPTVFCPAPIPSYILKKTGTKPFIELGFMRRVVPENDIDTVRLERKKITEFSGKDVFLPTPLTITLNITLTLSLTRTLTLNLTLILQVTLILTLKFYIGGDWVDIKIWGWRRLGGY